MKSSVFFFSPWKSKVPMKAIFGPFSVFFTDGKFFSRTLFHAQFVFSRALFNIFSRVWLFFSRTENWKFSRTGFCFHGQKFWLFFVLFFFIILRRFFEANMIFFNAPPAPRFFKTSRFSDQNNIFYMFFCAFFRRFFTQLQKFSFFFVTAFLTCFHYLEGFLGRPLKYIYFFNWEDFPGTVKVRNSKIEILDSPSLTLPFL